MAELPCRIAASVTNEFEILFARRSPQQAGPRFEFKSERNGLRVTWDPKICENGEDIRVIFEIIDLDGNLDPGVLVERFDATPEVAKLKISGAVGQRRIKYQAQPVKKV